MHIPQSWVMSCMDWTCNPCCMFNNMDCMLNCWHLTHKFYRVTPPFTLFWHSGVGGRHDTSFELWTAIIGPQTTSEKCFNTPIENALCKCQFGVEWGKNGIYDPIWQVTLHNGILHTLTSIQYLYRFLPFMLCVAGAHRHGLQSVVGKVARRMPPPANLPSLKSESQRSAVITAPPLSDNTGTCIHTCVL